MMRAHIALAALLMLTAACDEEASAEAEAPNAVSYDDRACDACGMIVRDQPAPRGQLVHRDGTRAFFCAISDLAAYVGAPSPHGDPSVIYVEVMEPDTAPDDLSTDERAWSDVQDAAFVVGDFPRPVMGRPVLTFADDEIGEAAAERLGGRALTWRELVTELGQHGGHAH